MRMTAHCLRGPTADPGRIAYRRSTSTGMTPPKRGQMRRCRSWPFVVIMVCDGFLMKSVEVAVVGGGVAGLIAAHETARIGLATSLFEDRKSTRLNSSHMS